MKSMNIYLNFMGKTEEAFNFYMSVFGGKLETLQRYGEAKEMPGSDKLSENDKEKLMHVSLPLGKSMLMGADGVESMGHKITQGNNFYVSVNADSRKETEKIFRALSEGGKVEMPLSDTFWGSYFGMLRDKFGIQWMVSYDKPKAE